MLLRSAVKARLRSSVIESPTGSLEAGLQDTLTRMRVWVLECVEALDQLDLELFQRLSGVGRIELAPQGAGAAPTKNGFDASQPPEGDDPGLMSIMCSKLREPAQTKPPAADSA
jgi:hypothetical protein